MLNYSMLYPRETVSRRVVSMDGMWKFCLDEKSAGENEKWQEGIPGKEMIPVPASFQDFYTEKDIREYAGDFWYEKDMFVPGEWSGKQVLTEPLYLLTEPRLLSMKEDFSHSVQM